MSRNADEPPRPDKPSRVRNIERIGREVNAVGIGGKRNVDPVIDKEGRPLACADRLEFPRKNVKLARWQVFFAKLERGVHSCIARGRKCRLAVGDDPSACEPPIRDEIKGKPGTGRSHGMSPDRGCYPISPVSGLEAVA